MSWFFRRAHDPRTEDYLRNTPVKYGRKTPIEAFRFLVLDTETTGFNVGSDRLLSLAGVEVRKNELNTRQSFEWILYQPAVTVNDAAKIHCILPSDTAGGQPEATVLTELLPLIRGAVIVGHHIAFDAAMIDHALHHEFHTRLRNPLVDTALLAMQAIEAFAKTGYANQRPPSLDEVCSHCGVPMVDRHTAAGDAFTTAELFLLLCARLRRRLNRPLIWDDLPKVRF